MKTATKAYLALATVCVLWGTSYLTMKIGVATIPPFLFSGIRQLSAGLILWIMVLISGQHRHLTLKDIGRQVLPGLLMIVLGNAVIGWAEQYIPSGLAALIVSAMPLYVTCIGMAGGNDRQQLNKPILLGLCLGALGILLIFRDNLADLTETNYLYGVLATFAAALCWAGGTVYIKRRKVRTGPLVNAAIQFSSGGIVLLLISPLLDDYSHLDAISSASTWSLVYLVFFGSIIPYLCYLYAIQHLQVGLVSVYAYINPFIAILLGVAVLGETAGWITALAFATTAAGVYWINKGHSLNTLKQKRNDRNNHPGNEVHAVPARRL